MWTTIFILTTVALYYLGRYSLPDLSLQRVKGGKARKFVKLEKAWLPTQSDT